jgi:hypothetical protein
MTGLCLLLMFAVVSTCSLAFVGLHWGWPVVFFVGLIIALHRHGTELEKARKK